MIPRWPADAAAFAILWAALALTLGPFIGAWLKHSTRHMPVPPPPEYEPDDSEAQYIAEQFADAAYEYDKHHLMGDTNE